MSVTRRILNQWRRLFARRQPTPWEDREVVVLLARVTENPWACKAIAECLDIDIDAGESVADFVAQQLQQYVDDKRVAELERRIRNIKEPLHD